jgi:hypothetical protein
MRGASTRPLLLTPLQLLLHGIEASTAAQHSTVALPEAYHSAAASRLSHTGTPAGSNLYCCGCQSCGKQLLLALRSGHGSRHQLLLLLLLLLLIANALTAFRRWHL